MSQESNGISVIDIIEEEKEEKEISDSSPAAKDNLIFHSDTIVEIDEDVDEASGVQAVHQGMRKHISKLSIDAHNKVNQLRRNS